MSTIRHLCQQHHIVSSSGCTGSSAGAVKTGSSQTPGKARRGLDPGETRNGNGERAISGTCFIRVGVAATAVIATIGVLNFEAVHEVRVVTWMQTGSQNGGHGLTLVTGAA